MAALVVAAPAGAQVPLTPTGPAADPDSVLVEELVVTALEPGPAWWRVKDADTTVYVLGVPSLAPKRMQWDRTVFERRLAGATYADNHEFAWDLADIKGSIAHARELLDRLDHERRAPVGERSVDLSLAVAGDGDPRVARDRDDLRRLAVGGQVHEHDGVGALRPRLPLRRVARGDAAVGAEHEEVHGFRRDLGVRGCRLGPVLEPLERVGEPLDVVVELALELDCRYLGPTE